MSASADLRPHEPKAASAAPAAKPAANHGATDGAAASAQANHGTADGAATNAQACSGGDAKADRQPSVSVVVAIYNKEQALDRCLESLRVQTYGADAPELLQIVCVDDASTDGSADLLSRHAAQDERILIAAMPSNGGPGAARDLGLSLATGDYVLFVDSDDYVEPDHVKSYVDGLDHGEPLEGTPAPSPNARPDIVIGSYTVHGAKGNRVLGAPQTQRGAWLCSSDCQRLYRRGFLEENGIDFRGSRYYEDVTFNYRCMVAGPSMRRIDRASYHYLLNDGSMTHAQGDVRKNYETCVLNHYEFFEEIARNGTLAKLNVELRTMLEYSFVQFLTSGMLYNIRRSDRPVAALFEQLRTECLDTLFPNWRRNPLIGLRSLPEEQPHIRAALAAYTTAERLGVHKALLAALDPKRSKPHGGGAPADDVATTAGAVGSAEAADAADADADDGAVADGALATNGSFAKTDASLAFVVLHYQSEELTETCLDTIAALARRHPAGRVHAVVVDNASPNGSGVRLYEKHASNPLVDVVLETENLGFSRANNHGFRHAVDMWHPDFIAVVNNDTEIRQPDFLERLDAVYREATGTSHAAANAASNPTEASSKPSSEAPNHDEVDTAPYVIGPDVFVERLGNHQSPLHGKPLSRTDIERRMKDAVAMMNANRLSYELKVRAVALMRSNPLTNAVLKARGASRGYENATWTTPARDCVLHGSALVFTPRFIATGQDPFSPVTFLYCEEELLALRCARNGWPVVYDPRLQVIHYDDGATDQVHARPFDKEVFVATEKSKSLATLLEFHDGESSAE